MLSLLCLGSCKTHARGLVISWVTGDVKSLPDEVADAIMNGPHKHSFRIVGGERDNAPPSEEKVDGAQEIPSPSNVDDGNASISLGDPLDSIELPLAKDASWIMVKNYLVSLEEKGELTVDIVRKVQREYPTYKSVQSECERLLSDLLQ